MLQVNCLLWESFDKFSTDRCDHLSRYVDYRYFICMYYLYFLFVKMQRIIRVASPSASHAAHQAAMSLHLLLCHSMQGFSHKGECLGGMLRYYPAHGRQCPLLIQWL